MALAAAEPREPAEVADLEEIRWIRRAQEGDVKAFEALYRRYVPRVYGLCLRMTAHAARAEDLTQEVFVRVWEKLHLFRGDRPLGPWLMTVAANVVHSDRRRRRGRDDREDSIDAGSAHRGPDVPPGRPDAGVDLEREIARLPRRAREVLVLHDIQGYRHEEIAGMLGVAVGTTKAQLHRARRILREAFGS